MAPQRAIFWDALERDKGAIVFTGDSLIANWRDLSKAFEGHKVANRAIGGDVSRGLLFRFRDDVLRLNPPTVVILIGTNDLSARAPANLVLSNIADIIKIAKATRSPPRLVLCAVPSRVGITNAIDITQQRTLNDGLLGMANDSSGIFFFDLQQALTGANGAAVEQYLESDGVHISAKGYTLFSAKLKRFLENKRIF